MRRLLLLIAAMATTAMMAADWLVAPMPAGFVVGYKLERGGNLIEEHVPKGENVNAWTRMITIQRFGGTAQTVGARGLLERIKAGLVQGCRGATVSAIIDGVENGRKTAAARFDCPLNPATGKPETFFAQVIAGTPDLHSVQYAFRHVPTAAETATARGYLASVRLCPAPDAACR